MKKLYFAAYYMSMGDIQVVGNKDGLVMKDAIITKEKNSLVFFNVSGEDGERKISRAALNKMRDFGTSIYGLFEKELTKNEICDLIIEKLEERVLETYRVKGALINIQSGS